MNERGAPDVAQPEATRGSITFLAFVPPGAPNQLFVRGQATLTTLIRSELKRLRRADDYPVTGIEWDRALEYENRWDVLPK